MPSINFLSGGQGPEEATANLNAINQQAANAPWQLSISYGRALQQPALQAWRGKSENIPAAQQALLKRARLNHLAMLGEYKAELENDWLPGWKFKNDKDQRLAAIDELSPVVNSLILELWGRWQPAPIDGVRLCKAVHFPYKNSVIIINGRKSDSWKPLKFLYDGLWAE